MNVHRLRARTDNYVWLMHDPQSGACTVVDASEAAPVFAAIAELGPTAHLAAIWCTHHHMDHVGGNAELLARWPAASVIGSDVDGAEARIPGQTVRVREGDRVALAGGAGATAQARVLFIPGHTRGHIAFVVGEGASEARLYCGDTLFGGGCGRLFEGTPAQMHDALSRLAALPDDTLVHCGHEYTWHNLRWAIELEPDNAALRARHAHVAADPAQLTVPTRLGEEKATNPFLRWESPALQALTGAHEPVAVFAALRSKKDAWRG